MIRQPTVPATKVVLVVEDDLAILALCRVTFQRARSGPLPDVLMIDAPDLAGARVLLASEAPDVVVMDVRLPDGSGLDMVRELRDNEPQRRLKVIVASASVLPSEREAAVTAGADRFLPKPYRPADLVDAVADLLRQAPF